MSDDAKSGDFDVAEQAVLVLDVPQGDSSVDHREEDGAERPTIGELADQMTGRS
jgi:hypothetical protein